MCRFLQIARGSASETEYHLLRAKDLHLLAEQDYQNLSRKADELQRILTGLIQSVRPQKASDLDSKLIARSSQLPSP
jgi:four helix bundle protein